MKLVNLFKKSSDKRKQMILCEANHLAVLKMKEKQDQGEDIAIDDLTMRLKIMNTIMQYDVVFKKKPSDKEYNRLVRDCRNYVATN